MKQIDPVLWLLAALIVFSACLVIYCEHMFPMDGQVFQVMSSLVSGFAGALLMRVKPATPAEAVATPPISTGPVTTVTPPPTTGGKPE
jgi:hypothetical protein